MYSKNIVFAFIIVFFSLVLMAFVKNFSQPNTNKQSITRSNSDTIDHAYPEEKHLKNVRQLTFGGDNAEAYFSFDGQKIVFQSNNKQWGLGCDQIFYFDFKEGDMRQKPQMISTGKGRTTCAYFMKGDSLMLYASTHLKHESCPVEPERNAGKYVWAVYPEFDVFVSDKQGNIKRQLTKTVGYDAEAVVSPKGDKILFTSMRSGDLDLWTMDSKGKNLKQITKTLGYDGGAFFSSDGSKIVFRASRPKTPEEQAEYKTLLKQGLVQPTTMEIFVCDVDGKNQKQITNLGKANWAPFFHPSGKKIIFSSNHQSQRGFQFNLYMINLDGTGLERISHDKVFDSFPMFSPDGKKIIFSSNRNNNGTRDTNIFVADWVE